MRTKLDSAVLHVLDFSPNKSWPMRRPSTAPAYRAEEVGLGSVLTSCHFQYNGRMESSRYRLKGPELRMQFKTEAVLGIKIKEEMYC